MTHSDKLVRITTIIQIKPEKNSSSRERITSKIHVHVITNGNCIVAL